MNPKLNICLIYSLLFSFQLLISQDISYTQFTDKDGLPSKKIYDIIQDSNKVLWMGTENGLVSYDGDNFIRHSHPDLFDNDIIEIALNRKGRLYFLNLGEQLGYIKDGEMVLIDINFHIEKIVNVISYDDKDFIATRGNKISKFYEINELPDRTFEFTINESYIFLYEENTYLLRESKNEFYRKKDSVAFYIDSITRKHFHTDNDKWYISKEPFFIILKQGYFIL